MGYGRRGYGELGAWRRPALDEHGSRQVVLCPRCKARAIRTASHHHTVPAESAAALAVRKALHDEIVAHLSSARFPVHNEEELRQAFNPPAELEIGGTSVGVRALVSLLSKRDYLFTNPHQIANLLAQRAVAAYVHEEARVFELGQTPGTASCRSASAGDSPGLDWEVALFRVHESPRS